VTDSSHVSITTMVFNSETIEMEYMEWVLESI
jgi:hypothetical protein